MLGRAARGAAMIGSLIFLGLVWFVLWKTGALRWLAMAAEFMLAPETTEKRELTWLQLKLGVLKRIAKEIGESERRIAEISDEEGAGASQGKAEGG